MHGAGPRSRELLTSGVEGLAPGERLPSDAAKAPDALSALATRDSGRPRFDDRVPADLDSDEESPSETPREPEVGAAFTLYQKLHGRLLTQIFNPLLRADVYFCCFIPNPHACTGSNLLGPMTVSNWLAL